MPRHDIVRRRVESLGDILQIDAVLAAINHRNSPAPRGRGRWSRQLREGEELLAQRVEIDLHGIVMHQQGSIGGHGLGHAGDGLARKRAIKRQYPLVRDAVDIAAEFHRNGAVATRSEEHTSELQSQSNLVCRLLLETKKSRWSATSSIRTAPRRWRRSAAARSP